MYVFIYVLFFDYLAKTLMDIPHRFLGVAVGQMFSVRPKYPTVFIHVLLAPKFFLYLLPSIVLVAPLHSSFLSIFISNHLNKSFLYAAFKLINISFHLFEEYADKLLYIFFILIDILQNVEKTLFALWLLFSNVGQV